MQEILFSSTIQVLTFFLETAIVVIGIVFIIAFSFRNKTSESLTIKDLNKKFKDYKLKLWENTLEKKELKEKLKLDKKKQLSTHSQPNTFVLQFKGDIKASAVDSLRESITALLTIATPQDEVVLALESPGGVVHGYGLAASQLQRIKDAGIPLVVCVDKVAASGGYMMACLADKIIAAPFAIIGSVGVVASVPNFNKKLKKNDVDYYQVTSGKYKRTLTLLGEVTDEGLEKFKEEIEETHELFKRHIQKFRPSVDIEKIATGEHWYGEQALPLKLVDELGTSDDYLLKQSSFRSLKEIEFKSKKGMLDKLTEGFAQLTSPYF